MMKTLFKNNKLIIFNEIRVMVIRFWPDPRAWYMEIEKNTWQPFRPHILYPEGKIEIVKRDPLLLARKDQPNPNTPKSIIEAFSTIPQQILEYIKDFPCGQWHLLNGFYRIPYFKELMDSTPALAWMLARNWIFHPNRKPYRTARNLIKKKQKEICGWLGFPEHFWTVKILRKLDKRFIHPITLFRLRKCLYDKNWVKVAMQVPYLNSHSLYGIRFVAHKIISYNCYMEFFETKTDWGILYDLINMTRSLNETEKQYTSLREVYNLHERHRVRISQKDLYKDLNFPPPPIQGISGKIEPITNPKDLKEEGMIMKHCVYSYARKVAEGSSYIYRILKPERATMEIVKVDGIWVLNQVYGMANSKVPQETLYEIKKFLNMQNGFLKYPSDNYRNTIQNDDYLI